MKISKKPTMVHHIMVEDYEMLSQTPLEVQQLVLEGLHYLNAKGHMVESSFIFPSFDDKIVVARMGGKPIGFITYSQPGWKKCTFIAVGYVHPDYRNRGVYTKLFKRLNDIAHKAGHRQIYGSTHVTNQSMQEVMGALKRKPNDIGYLYDVAAPPADRKEKVKVKKAGKKKKVKA